MPTCSRLTTIPVIAQTPTIGARQISTFLPLVISRSPIVALVTASRWPPSASVEEIPVPRRWTIEEPVRPITNRPASSVMAPERSVDLATCPDLRASSRRLGVAFSVLSGSAICGHLLAEADALEGGPDVGLQLGAEPVGD